MKLSATQILAIGAVGLAGAVLFFGQKKIAAAAGAVGGAVNPVSRDNILYRGVNELGDALDDGDTSNNTFSVGSWLYDVFHVEYDPNRSQRGAGIDGA